jgi:two-component system, chemotaxis family, chemotaxis protein CheY
VDDSISYRKFIFHTLKMQEELDVFEAADAIEALDILGRESGKMDLILLDFFMPKMNGLEFFRKMITYEEYKSIPVIMITTSGDKSRMVEAVQAGIRDYLTKPFTPEDLLTRIIKILKITV